MDIFLKVIPDSFHVEDEINYCAGEIKIDNDFESCFRMALNFWSVKDYESQWEEGLARIKTHDSSCLVTCVQSPILSGQYIEWWTLHKEDNKVYMQNELILGDVYPERVGSYLFSPQTCYNFIGERNPKKQLGWVEMTKFVLDL